jgi:hypothetical protein
MRRKQDLIGRRRCQSRPVDGRGGHTYGENG